VRPQNVGSADVTRPLQISAAKEVDVKGGKKAIVIFVPVPQLKAFHKIQGRLTRELEKKCVGVAPRLD